MRSILLVEDTPDDVFFLQRAFKKAGIESPLNVAVSGQDAVVYLEKACQDESPESAGIPCLVLLDLKLPHLSGLEVLQWIRQRKDLSTMPVIVLTSSREDRDIQQAYSLGANSFKVKPPDANELAAFALALKMYWLEHDEACTSSTNARH